MAFCWAVEPSALRSPVKQSEEPEEALPPLLAEPEDEESVLLAEPQADSARAPTRAMLDRPAKRWVFTLVPSTA